jgi:hypothetical protein
MSRLAQTSPCGLQCPDQHRLLFSRHFRVQLRPLWCRHVEGQHSLLLSRQVQVQLGGPCCVDTSRCSKGPRNPDTSRCVSGPYGIDMSRPAQTNVVWTRPGVGLCFADKSRCTTCLCSIGTSKSSKGSCCAATSRCSPGLCGVQVQVQHMALYYRHVKEQQSLLLCSQVQGQHRLLFSR